MTARNINLNAFVLDVAQGRTREPLNILGADTLVKLADADSDGAAVVFQQTVPPLAGPPLHRHANEDEWFYVLEGTITVEIDGERTILSGGGSAFAPRGTAHTYQNFERAPSQLLVVVTPGRFQRFFEDLSLLSNRQAPPDLAAIEHLAKEYGIEILGPPLS